MAKMPPFAPKSTSGKKPMPFAGKESKAEEAKERKMSPGKKASGKSRKGC